MKKIVGLILFSACLARGQGVFPPSGGGGGGAATSIDAGGATSVTNGTNGNCLYQAAGKVAEQACGGGITIDTTAITGGAANRCLFESTTNKVSESAECVFEPTSGHDGRLSIGGPSVNWYDPTIPAGMARGIQSVTGTLTNDGPDPDFDIIGDLFNWTIDPASTGDPARPIHGRWTAMETPTTNSKTINAMYLGINVGIHNGSGALGSLYGHYNDLENAGMGSIGIVYGYTEDVITNGGTAYGYHLFSLGGSGTTTDYAYFAPDLAGTATNPYYSWFDSQGVRRVKEDSTFNSVGQAIEALYNPQFTKYTPGAADFERIVEQWESNVAVITTEKGGTGTLEAMRIGDPGVQVTVNGSPITPFSGLYVGPDESSPSSNLAFQVNGFAEIDTTHTGNLGTYSRVMAEHIQLTDTGTAETLADVYPLVVEAQLTGSGDYLTDGDGLTGLSVNVSGQDTIQASYLIGAQITVGISGTPTITDQRGLYIATASAISVTNSAALYIENVNGAANNWAILTKQGKVEWGDVEQEASVVFSALPSSPVNGMMIFCSDCQPTTVTMSVIVDATCKAMGTGALAVRINSKWNCAVNF